MNTFTLKANHFKLVKGGVCQPKAKIFQPCSSSHFWWWNNPYFICSVARSRILPMNPLFWRKTRDELLKLKILVTSNGKRLTSDCGLRFAVSYAKLDAKGLYYRSKHELVSYQRVLQKDCLRRLIESRKHSCEGEDKPPAFFQSHAV